MARSTPKSGRRPGNADTRGQILAAARHAFADKGFAGASVRGIAADAGVDAALIHHYFDNKQQLFLATVSLPPGLPDLLEQVGAGGVDGMGERMVRTVLGVWDSELQPRLVAAVRAALAEPGMSRSIGEFLSLEIISHVLRRADVPAHDVSRRAGLVGSQMLGLIMGRYLLRLPGLTDRPAEELVGEIGPTLQRYLDGSS